MFFEGRATDKYRGHAYAPVYEALLSPRAEKVRRVLEIGVGDGSSLLGWTDAFPNAEIEGIDIAVGQVTAKHERIAVHAGNAADWNLLGPAVEGKTYDLIVDDGSHRRTDQLTSFFFLWPFVSAGGFYVIEDVQDPLDIARWRALGFTVYDFRHLKGLPDDILCVRQKEQ